MAVPRARSRAVVADEALILSLYEEHGRALLAYATRLTGDHGAAEDVVQETLVRAWRHPDALASERGSVGGWLLTVTRNIVTDRYRRRAVRPAEVAESAVRPAIQRDHADSVVNSMTVLDALARLSPEHRDVLTEIYLRGASVAEAARALGVPPGTVKSRSHYALVALRRIFGIRPLPHRAPLSQATA
jgi:RNA polymerase sigma-70 factor, ECF subfamily